MSFAMDPSSNLSSATTYLSEQFIDLWPSSWSGPTLLVILIGYVALCSSLRFRRVNSVRSHYGFNDRAHLGRMTNEEAFQIAKGFISYDCPLFYDLGLRVALFRVLPMLLIVKMRPAGKLVEIC